MSAGIAALEAGLRSSILGDNFSLSVVSWSPGSTLSSWGGDGERARAEALARMAAEGWPERIVGAAATAYLDGFRSGLLAARGFALNLFRMDEDNWFSLDAAIAASAWFEEPAKLAERRELWLLKGVSVRPLLPGRVVPPDLPLVADYGDDTLSLVVVGLAD